MKTKNIFLLVLIWIGTGLLQAQHENDNWKFGNSKWHFDSNTAPNGFTQTTNLTPYIRYGASVINDKNTGELLFFSNGYSVYNKNNVIMQDGNHLFGSSNTYPLYEIRGNPSDQSSIIVPIPGSSTKFYVFFINGNRKSNDDETYSNNPPVSTNYGLGYAVVDLSFNGGLGKVTSKGMLFTNSETNALTSTVASDGNSYWVVTANNGNFLSYKVDANGLNTTPVTSSASVFGNFFKISPDTKKLVTRLNSSWPNNGVFLYDFNNTTGTITNQHKITPNIASSMYYDNADYVNSAEFSSDSNIVYFTISSACLCGAGNLDSGIAMYNISTDQLVGYTQNGPNSGYDYPFFLKGISASLQRAQNGKIYLMQAYKSALAFNLELVKFGSTLNNVYYPYDWAVINTPDVWNTGTNPLSYIAPMNGTKNGYSFPQLIPTFDSLINPCPDVLTITTPVTSSQNYQAGKSIFASSAISDNVTVNYKAGVNVNLLPGFKAMPAGDEIFKANIVPCSMASFSKGGTANTPEPDFAKTNLNAASSDVKIYPNPASTVVKIDSGTNKVAGWVLYDLSGKTVLNGSDLTIPVEKLPKSSYLLIIKLDNGKSTSKKIIVQ